METSYSGQHASEYVEDDDSASNSSAEVEKPPVSLFNDEAAAAEAVERLQAVLGSTLRLNEEEDDDEVSSALFKIPSLDGSSRERDELFASLLDDVLATVFRKLSNKDLANCSLVSKWWFMVDALSRSSLSLRASDELGPQLPKLLNRFQGVHKLVLKCERNMQSINDDALDLIAKNSPRLRKFKLKNCKQITDVGMEKFARSCPELRKFSCGGCGFGLAGLSALLRNCTVLEDLTIKRSIKSLPAPAQAPPALDVQGDGTQLLTVALQGGGRLVVGLPFLVDDSGNPVPNAAAAGAAGGANDVGAGAAQPNGGAPPAAPPAPVVPAVLDLPPKLNLRRLCLKDQGSSQMWVPLLEAARKVETLILARNNGPWDAVLGSSLGAGRMPELTQLYLEKLHISDASLRSVSRCPKLEALVVVRTSECTDEGISAIAQGCPQLKRLHIEGWAPGHIGDRGLNSLAHHCRLLQELVLVGHSCTVASMQPLASHCPGLERLTLCSSLSMSDAEMRVIAASCPSLRRLCVKACMRVTDTGILALATGCPSLQKLKIRRCNGVSQNGLDALQGQRPELSITQESSSAATAAAEARLRDNRAAQAAGGEGREGGAAGGAQGNGRIFDERGDIDALIAAGRRRGDQRDESPEVLRRFGSLGGAAGDALLARQALRSGGGASTSGTRGRLAQAATSFGRALRSLMGGPGSASMNVGPSSAAANGGGLPPVHPTRDAVREAVAAARSVSPTRNRENREQGRE